MATRRLLLFVGLCGFVLGEVGCGDLQPERPPKPVKPVVKLTITRKGEYIVDGTAVDLAQLDQAFADAQAKSADLWCYRENPGEPPEAYLELMKVVARHKVLLQYVAKPDFSLAPTKKPLTINY